MSAPNGDLAHGVGLAANAGLALGKLVIGLGAGSQALLADAANSVGDIVATGVGWIAFRLARRPPDADHHYGHGNIEALAGLLVALGLAGTGLGIAWTSIDALRHGTASPPAWSAAAAATVTIGVKAALSVYVTRVGRALRSPTLLASAADHRADVLASSGVLIAVVGARLGLPWLDAVMGALLGVWIAWLAVAPARDNLGVLLDEAPPEAREQVRALLAEDPAVCAVREVRVHPLGQTSSVQVVVAVDPALTVAEADAIALRLTTTLRAADPHCGHVAIAVRAASAAELGV